MNYEQALEYLASLSRFGMNFGLFRIENLLALMGNPERRYTTVHITGTNGKGSTTAMITAMLKAAGIKTAMYTSPHLTDYTERMVINGQPISRETFGEAVGYTSAFVAAMVEEGWEHPTEFEVLTAAAFYCFAAAGVEYAVVEVGLGGLLDSTNVIIPCLSVITNVTLEHTDRCGSTVVEIARHKAGIIKHGVPVITSAQGSALDVIKAVAKEKRAAIYVVGEHFSGTFEGFKENRQIVKVTTQPQTLHVEVNLLGQHQVENAATAVMVGMRLAEKDKRVTLDAIKNGLKTVFWPGRFELFPGSPPVVLDGAHNPAGAEALRRTIDEVFPERKITFVLGILADKDVVSICGALVRPDDIAVTVEPMSDRAADPRIVAEKITASRIEVATSITGGIEQALLLAGEKGVVCVAGSLYLIGSARPYILSRQNHS